jgi:salicylate hydroxylase
LGLAEKVLQRGAIIRHLYGKSANGRIVFDISYAKLKPHFFGLGIHRGALFSILYDEVQRLNVPIKASCDITKTQIENEKHILKDKTGNHYGPFDLVIDASGMHSSLRDENGQIKYNKPYPYGAIWGVCEDPGQSFGKDYLQQRYDGAKMMIGMLSIGKRPSDGKEALTFFWSLPVSTYNQWRETGLDSWKVKVLGYWPELEPFLKQFQSVDDLTFAQYSDIIMDRWHCDRLVFIGDAAHCTSPQLGQGANLGLIDALILSTCLRKNKDVNEAIA